MIEFNHQPKPDQCPVIVNALRTPIGKAFGSLATVSAVDLLTPVLQRLVEASKLNVTDIDEVLVGNAAGGGGNVARLASLQAGLPVDVPGLSVDRQCGSGLETIMLASRLIQSGAGECYIAGGVESISTAPWRVEKPSHPRQQPRFYGRAKFAPESIGDPEMGVAAENVAKKFDITRKRQDSFALTSHIRAIEAQDANKYDNEIVLLHLGDLTINKDECPRRSTSMEALAELPPVFNKENGSVTAGNSCPLNDGASAVLIMSRRLAREYGVKKGLKFIDGTSAGTDPNLLGVGPVPSTKKLFHRQQKLSLSDISNIEFNEAFASQVLASLDQLSINSQDVNKEGGAIALGHPFGASGAILVTRLFSQSIREGREGELSLAMLGIAGGLGLTSLFQWTENV